jgi:hypothetical protein
MLKILRVYGSVDLLKSWKVRTPPSVESMFHHGIESHYVKEWVENIYTNI